jgi:hypothetical protein
MYEPLGAPDLIRAQKLQSAREDARYFRAIASQYAVGSEDHEAPMRVAREAERRVDALGPESRRTRGSLGMLELELGQED